MEGVQSSTRLTVEVDVATGNGVESTGVNDVLVEEIAGSCNDIGIDGKTRSGENM